MVYFPRKKCEMDEVEEVRRYMLEDYTFEKEYWERIEYEQRYLKVVDQWKRYGEGPYAEF